MNEGIRFASTTEELHGAYNLRYRVYVESMGRFADSCDHDNRELKDAYDNHSRILVAVKKGQVVGTLRLLWGGDKAFDKTQQSIYDLPPFLKILGHDKICLVERFILDESRRGSAMMLKMLNAVMHFVFEQRIELLLINAESKHQASYEKLGCLPFTKRRMYPGIGPTTPMALNVGDLDHLRAISSPFAVLAKPDDVAYCQHTDRIKTTISNEAAQAALSRIGPIARQSTCRSRAANPTLYKPACRTFEERLKQRLAL